MSIYEITTEKGIYQITTEDKKQSQAFIPNQQEVENKISQRQDSLETLRQEVNKPYDFLNHPIASALKPIVTGAKAISVPLQRAESGLANAGLSLQSGNPQDFLGAMMKGLGGQRQVQFGDIVRTTGFGGELNEAISSTVGLLPTLASIGNPTKQIIGKVAQDTQKLVKDISEYPIIPRVMNDEWLIDKSKRLHQITEDVMKGIKEEYNNVYSSIGNKAVNEVRVQNAIKNIFGGAKEEIAPLAEELKNELIAEGNEKIKANIDTVKKIKDIVQKYIPKSAWSKGKTGGQMTPTQQKLANSYFELKNIIYDSLGQEGNADRELLKTLDDKATKAYRVTGAVKKMLIDETGEPVRTDRLINVFTGGGKSAGKRDLLNRLAEMHDSTNQVMKDMDKFNMRQKLKASIGRIAPWIIGGGILGHGIVRVGEHTFGE